MRSALELSLVIISKDEWPDLLKQTVASFRRTIEVEHEIIVVDDCSEKPIDYLDDDCRVLRSEVPLGTCAARRLGSSVAKGRVLCNCDSHMSFQSGWWEEMAAALDGRTLVCSAFRIAEGETPSQGSRLLLGPQGFEFSYPKAVRRRYREVPILVGACYLFEHSLYQELGGFSPLFWGWGIEEHDLSCRAWLAGARVVCATRANVYHQSRRTAGDSVWVPGQSVYNARLLIRTLFEEKTQEFLEQVLLPANEAELSRTDESAILAWQRECSSRRLLADEEFFQRLWPDGPIRFKSGKPEWRPRYHPLSWSFQELCFPPLEAHSGLAGQHTVLRFEVLGHRFELSGEELVMRALETSLPRPRKPWDSGAASLSIRVAQSRSGYQLLYGDKSTAQMPLGSLGSELSRVVLQHLLENDQENWYLEACALQVGKELLLLPGALSTGSLGLALELEKRGAELLSDRYWVLSPRGETRALLCSPLSWKARSPEGSYANFERVQVLFTQFAPRRSFRRRRLSFSQGFPKLLQSLIGNRDRGALISVLGKILRKSEFFRISRGNLEQAAKKLLGGSIRA